MIAKSICKTSYVDQAFFKQGHVDQMPIYDAPKYVQTEIFPNIYNGHKGAHWI